MVDHFHVFTDLRLSALNWLAKVVLIKLFFRLHIAANGKFSVCERKRRALFTLVWCDTRVKRTFISIYIMGFRKLAQMMHSKSGDALAHSQEYRFATEGSPRALDACNTTLSLPLICTHLFDIYIHIEQNTDKQNTCHFHLLKELVRLFLNTLSVVSARGFRLRPRMTGAPQAMSGSELDDVTQIGAQAAGDGFDHLLGVGKEPMGLGQLIYVMLSSVCREIPVN